MAAGLARQGGLSVLWQGVLIAILSDFFSRLLRLSV
jgi:hypothetical protein